MPSPIPATAAERFEHAPRSAVTVPTEPGTPIKQESLPTSSLARSPRPSFSPGFSRGLLSSTLSFSTRSAAGKRRSLAPVHGTLDLVAHRVVDPVCRDQELPVAVLRYAQRRVLLQLPRDLRERPVGLFPALVDAVDYAGDGVSRVDARGGPRRARDRRRCAPALPPAGDARRGSPATPSRCRPSPKILRRSCLCLRVNGWRPVHSETPAPSSPRSKSNRGYPSGKPAKPRRDESGGTPKRGAGP